jgi:DNA-directed RNA polymerase specialized sigma24 family protein
MKEPQKRPTDRESPGLPDDISWREACRVLEEELARLPPALREAIIICSLQTRTAVATAKKLQVSARTV